MHCFYDLVNGFSGQKMDDLSRIPVNHCPKVFVQRDYNNGTQLAFSTKFPQELEGKVTALYDYKQIFVCFKNFF